MFLRSVQEQDMALRFLIFLHLLLYTLGVMTDEGAIYAFLAISHMFSQVLNWEAAVGDSAYLQLPFTISL